MHHHLIGPLWGNIIVITVGGAITIACFIAMFWMMFRPGEHNPNHPKYKILNKDR